MASSETAILNKIMIAASKLGFVFWRNHRGGAWMGKSKQMGNGDVLVYQAKFHRFGVGQNGGSDLIGYRKVTIAPEMIGTQALIFSCIEVKAPGKLHTAKQEQIDFVNAVNALGGYGKVLDSEKGII